MSLMSYQRALWRVALTTMALVSLCVAVPLMKPSLAQAHEVSPMRVFLIPAEGRDQAMLSINNTRAQNLPVEIKAVVRHVATDGTETFEDAPDAFVIFPLQVEVPSQTTQAVRVQYMGPPVDAAQAYVIQVNEVPVVPDGFSGVHFTYNFGVAVYVEPPRAVERLSIISAEPIEEGVRLVVRNTGSKFGILQMNRLSLSFGDQTLDLTGEDLGSRIGNPLLPPGSDRTIDVAVPELSAGQSVTAVIRSL